MCRIGPNKPNIIAITIPIADAGKLLLKEEKLTTRVNIKYYFMSPISITILAILL